MLLFVATQVSAQKYFTKTGVTDFKASVAAFEPVEATSKSTTVILNTETGQMASLLFVKSFRFKVALMEEHFNENYMESDKFPKATFSGTLKDFDLSNVSETVKEFPLVGKITVRGVEKEVTTVLNVKKVADKLICEGSFNLNPSDFNIKIPSIVRKKISEQIQVILNYELVKK